MYLIDCCEHCKHWTRGTIPVIQQPSYGGVCSNPELRLVIVLNIMTKQVREPRITDQTVETAEDFGCVQFEQRRDK